MNGQATGPGQLEWTARALAWGRGRLTATGHGVALGVLALAEAVVWALLMVVAVLSGCVIGLPLVAASVLGVRRLTGLTRQLSAQWCGVPITAAYRPPPAALTAPGPGRPVADLRARLRWLLSDQATWRDLLWMVANPCLGVVIAGGSAAMIIFGVFGMVLPHGSTPIAGTLSHPWLGIALAAAGFWSAPWLLRGYGEFARWVLGPTRRAELTRQVSHLARTRADAIDAGAAEVRRIERDLHDGAQARLVSMGMTLDAAGQLLETNPAAARALLAEARDSSVKALGELRDLVRGIHPPVLADRGLADAVQALALDLPLRVRCASELPGRPPAPVESAAYFAVSELLANVSKHAEADQAWVDIRHSAGMLRIGVTDDGRGGADPARGTGLRGIERRLAAFDGVLAVSSPPGGPTVVNMEIPCALSSPKTSSC